ncbi:Cna B-type domain-containing protein, partial [Vibrio sp. FNV 38]|nr:Cna B-type domain-containing protein [Vibrio sp. FNV 38]
YKAIDDITFEVSAIHETTWDVNTKEKVESTRTEVLTELAGSQKLEEGEIAAIEVQFAKDITEGSLTTDIRNESELVPATVKKVWDDDENRDGLRAPVTVHLLADGEDTGKKVTLNELNNWIDQISGLPKMKNDRQIKYTWSEDVPEGYTMT